MQDASGRYVAAPLRRGSPLCLFHARPFCIQPAIVDGPVVIIYLDLVPVLRNKCPHASPTIINLVEHIFESNGGDHWR